jgi:hypothetical protein
MNKKLVVFGLSCIITSGIIGIITGLAKAQMMWPNGYYLATNGLCYPYQQQQQPAQTAADPELVHICKINHDMIAVDKSLGVNASQLLPLEKLYNDTCGTIAGVN